MSGVHHFTLKCVACGREYAQPDGTWRLACDGEKSKEHGPSLLRAVYDKQPHPLAPADASCPVGSLARYAHLLPVALPEHVPEGAAAPAAFRLEKLGAKLGLRNLWASFCGHWPEHGARMETCTFKELEASSVCARLASLSAGADRRQSTLVVASAGNTARAFAQAFSRHAATGKPQPPPLVVVVPEDALPSLWSPVPFDAERVRLVVVSGAGADYSDAIRMGDCVARLPGFVPEGGARNVARRDGMGVATLVAVDALGGRAPQHYFQAIGSGTGAVAAWEAAEKFRKEGEKPMVLHCVQNLPFVPMHEAWLARSRNLLPSDEAEDRRKISQVAAHVLTNRAPPYAIAGGVFDALVATEGRTYAVTNEEAAAAAKLFEETEGCDVDVAATVTLAALCSAAKSGSLPADDTVLINITGGGRRKLFAEQEAAGLKMHYLQPFAVVDRKDVSDETARKLFSS